MDDDSTVTSAGSELPDDLLKKLRIQIPGYQILQQIGAGGQARVFKAVRASDSLIVAIKILQSGPLVNENAQSRFHREILALKSLNHPGIVPVWDHGQTPEGYDFLVMEFIDGKSLDQFILDQRFLDQQSKDPNSLLRLFIKICDAVNCAHRAGITHRDLSPSNIIIDTEGAPHIVDFGLARTAFDAFIQPHKQVSVTGQFLGKLAYASPEQVQGVPEKIDIRSDVYALGVILYELLTGGRFPYVVVGNMADIFDAIVKSQPTPPSKRLAASVATESQANRRIKLQYPPVVSSLIDAIVLKALEKNPDDRYQSAGHLAADIENYLEGRPVTASSSPRKQEPIRITLDAVKSKPGISIKFDPVTTLPKPFLTRGKVAITAGSLLLFIASCVIAMMVASSISAHHRRTATLAYWSGLREIWFQSLLPKSAKRLVQGETLITGMSNILQNLAEQIDGIPSADVDPQALDCGAQMSTLLKSDARLLDKFPSGSDQFFTIIGAFMNLPGEIDEFKKDHQAILAKENTMWDSCRKARLDLSQKFSVHLDPVIPPALIGLVPFMVDHGFYVRVVNMSPSEPINPVLIYTDAAGHSSRQSVAPIGRQTYLDVDPSQIPWIVEPGETIEIQVGDYSYKYRTDDLFP